MSMGREIKFRAWYSNYNVMIYFDNFHICGEYSTLSWRSSAGEYDGIGRLPDYPGEDTKEIELMQYTGLKDKNDKEIYEGDIIQRDDPPYENFDDLFKGGQGIVESGCFGWHIKNTTGGDWSWYTPEGGRNFLSDEIEVVGNIYEKD